MIYVELRCCQGQVLTGLRCQDGVSGLQKLSRKEMCTSKKYICMVRIRSPLDDVVSNVAGYFILSCQSYVSNGLETTTYDFGLASLESTAESRKSPDWFLPVGVLVMYAKSCT